MIPVFAPWLSDNVRRYVLECVDSGWISSLGGFVERFEPPTSPPPAPATRSARRTAPWRCTSRCTASASGRATRSSSPTSPSCLPPTPSATRRDTGASSTPTRTLGHGSGRRAAGSSRRGPRRSSRSTSTGIPSTWIRSLALARRRTDSTWSRMRPRRTAPRYEGRRVGTLGDVGAFSLLRQQDHHHRRGRHGGDERPGAGRAGCASSATRPWIPTRRYYHPEIGFNYRMTNIQAAIGCAQLEQADAILGRRKAIAAAYEAGLAGIAGLTRPPGRALGRERLLDVLGAGRAGVRARPRGRAGGPPRPTASTPGRSSFRSTSCRRTARTRRSRWRPRSARRGSTCPPARGSCPTRSPRCATPCRAGPALRAVARAMRAPRT